MTAATGRRSRAPASEEAAAAARVVVGVTIGVGGLASLIGLASGEQIALIGLPTLAVVAAVVRGSVPAIGWASAAVWAFLLPHAHEEALVAPLAMIVLSLGIAIGPERLLGWLGRDVARHATPEARPGDGWIEEDGHPVD